MDYSKAVVYKICCKDIDIKDCYVGSTTCLRNRKNKHKSNCNNEKNKEYNKPTYQFIRDNGGWNNWEVVMLEEYPECKSGEELLKYEREYMEMLCATLNKQVPSRTQKEYREDNREKLQVYFQEYHEKNKEKLNAKRREWHENNKEEQNAKMREYHEKNKEKENVKSREWYEKHREETNAKRREKVECEFCKRIVNKGNIKKHQKTQKCLKAQGK